MNADDRRPRAVLQRIAHRVMLEKGLLPDFSGDVIAELSRIHSPASPDNGSVRDLRDMLWCSIDNDDSRDLDQLTVARKMPADKAKVFVAIADVDAIVKLRSAIDEHACTNTTSVYTAAEIFPMLPEKLSTDLTSLNPNEDRMAIVAEMVVGSDGSVEDSSICRALVRNHAKLAYNSIAAWLEGDAPAPEAVSAAPGLDDNLRLQDETAQKMRSLRHVRGALSLQTIKAKPVFDGDELCSLEVETQNRAQYIIEDFMIGANGVIARYLASAGFPSIRRVVRTPDRWDRIVELARQHGFRLSDKPDSGALEQFLRREKAADPERFPDLSLSVIKLIGNGEYVAEMKGGTAPGHFGLAVKDYAHSTAPNRRYPDLITQRLLKAALEGRPCPYRDYELEDLARHCTEAEDEANKVERQVGKSAAALLLERRIGDRFDAFVTGVSGHGVWARLLDIPVEGKLVGGFEGLDVGDRIRVQLAAVDVERGYIDFKKAGRSSR